MNIKPLPIVFIVLLICSCGDDHGGNSHDEITDASLPGVYAGAFPCEGCSGIATTLWLRADGRYFFRQQYPPDVDPVAMNVYSLGRWSMAGDQRAIVLTGAGPSRTFSRPERDVLEMQTDSSLEHRLIRDRAAPDFSASIRMAGVMSVRGGRASFSECLTGLSAPVNTGGEFARFQHQYRSVGGQGKPAYVELEGRFTWDENGSPTSLTITRFVTIKMNEAC